MYPIFRKPQSGRLPTTAEHPSQYNHIASQRSVTTSADDEGVESKVKKGSSDGAWVSKQKYGITDSMRKDHGHWIKPILGSPDRVSCRFCLHPQSIQARKATVDTHAASVKHSNAVKAAGLSPGGRPFGTIPLSPAALPLSPAGTARVDKIAMRHAKQQLSAQPPPRDPYPYHQQQQQAGLSVAEALNMLHGGEMVTCEDMQAVRAWLCSQLPRPVTKPSPKQPWSLDHCDAAEEPHDNGSLALGCINAWLYYTQHTRLAPADNGCVQLLNFWSASHPSQTKFERKMRPVEDVLDTLLRIHDCTAFLGVATLKGPEHCFVIRHMKDRGWLLLDPLLSGPMPLTRDQLARFANIKLFYVTLLEAPTPADLSDVVASTRALAPACQVPCAGLGSSYAPIAAATDDAPAWARTAALRGVDLTPGLCRQAWLKPWDGGMRRGGKEGRRGRLLGRDSAASQPSNQPPEPELEAPTPGPPPAPAPAIVSAPAAAVSAAAAMSAAAAAAPSSGGPVKSGATMLTAESTGGRAVRQQPAPKAGQQPPVLENPETLAVKDPNSIAPWVPSPGARYWPTEGLVEKVVSGLDLLPHGCLSPIRLCPVRAPGHTLLDGPKRQAAGASATESVREGQQQQDGQGPSTPAQVEQARQWRAWQAGLRAAGITTVDLTSAGTCLSKASLTTHSRAAPLAPPAHHRHPAADSSGQQKPSGLELSPGPDATEFANGAGKQPEPHGQQRQGRKRAREGLAAESTTIPAGTPVAAAISTHRKKTKREERQERQEEQQQPAATGHAPAAAAAPIAAASAAIPSPMHPSGRVPRPQSPPSPATPQLVQAQPGSCWFISLQEAAMPHNNPAPAVLMRAERDRELAQTLRQVEENIAEAQALLDKARTQRPAFFAALCGSPGNEAAVVPFICMAP
ncbi:hypothetical protein QJQ45_000919 [Haematococcus lacustris]|nr:hypothetical protein QJQ45_000919 [Haematococcus lacustris]